MTVKKLSTLPGLDDYRDEIRSGDVIHMSLSGTPGSPGFSDNGWASVSTKWSKVRSNIITDEQDLSGSSPDMAPSQRSVKEYVDETMLRMDLIDEDAVFFSPTMQVSVIQDIIDEVPKNLGGHTVAFQFNDGEYTLGDQLLFNNFSNGRIKIQGNVVGGEADYNVRHTNQRVKLNIINQTHGIRCEDISCDVEIRNLKLSIKNANDVHGIHASNTSCEIDGCYIYIDGTSTSTSTVGIFSEYGNSRIMATYIANVHYGVIQDTGICYVYNCDNLGSLPPVIGMTARKGGIIGWHGTKLDGSQQDYLELAGGIVQFNRENSLDSNSTYDVPTVNAVKTQTDALNTYWDRGYKKMATAPVNLVEGWYTVAYGNEGRSNGRIAVWDTSSSVHQSVIFNAASMYANPNNVYNGSLSLYESTRYSFHGITKIRIQSGDTYSGAVVQAYVTGKPITGGHTNRLYSGIVGDDYHGSGWHLVDWLPANVKPPNMTGKIGGVALTQAMYESAFRTIAHLTLTDMPTGGIMTTGDMYVGSNTVSAQYEVLHDGRKENSISTSTDKVPTSSAVKTYTDTKITERAVTLTGDQTISGNKTFVNRVKLASGSQAIPSLVFSADGAQDTGLFWAADGVIGITTNAGQAAQFNKKQLLMQSAGTITEPAFSWIGDVNTGLYRSNQDELGITAGAVNIAVFRKTGTGTGQLLMNDGMVSRPSYSFNQDADSGMYSPNDTTIGFAINGVKRAWLSYGDFHAVNKIEAKDFFEKESNPPTADNQLANKKYIDDKFAELYDQLKPNIVSGLNRIAYVVNNNEYCYEGTWYQIGMHTPYLERKNYPSTIEINCVLHVGQHYGNQTTVIKLQYEYEDDAGEWYDFNIPFPLAPHAANGHAAICHADLNEDINPIVINGMLYDPPAWGLHRKIRFRILLGVAYCSDNRAMVYINRPEKEYDNVGHWNNSRTVSNITIEEK